jgi:hypothetical protein
MFGSKPISLAQADGTAEGEVQKYTLRFGYGLTRASSADVSG